jgi:hypothetical protein
MYTLLISQTVEPDPEMEDMLAMKAARAAVNLELHPAVTSAQEDIATFVQDTSPAVGRLYHHHRHLPGWTGCGGWHPVRHCLLHPLLTHGCAYGGCRCRRHCLSACLRTLRRSATSPCPEIRDAVSSPQYYTMFIACPCSQQAIFNKSLF